MQQSAASEMTMELTLLWHKSMMMMVKSLTGDCLLFVVYLLGYMKSDLYFIQSL